MNGLAFCAQEVLASAEEMKEAAVGAPSKRDDDSGLEHAAVAADLSRNAESLEQVQLPEAASILARETAATPELSGFARVEVPWSPWKTWNGD